MIRLPWRATLNGSSRGPPIVVLKTASYSLPIESWQVGNTPAKSDEISSSFQEKLHK